MSGPRHFSPGTTGDGPEVRGRPPGHVRAGPGQGRMFLADTHDRHRVA
ncbi:hypothetical protein AB0L04_23885 [Streptomyces glaucescens]